MQKFFSCFSNPSLENLLTSEADNPGFLVQTNEGQEMLKISLDMWFNYKFVDNRAGPF